MRKSKQTVPAADEEVFAALSAEALDIAMGWSVLSPGLQHHVKLVIDDHLSRLSPTLEKLYGATNSKAQLRAEGIAKRAGQRFQHKRGAAT